MALRNSIAVVIVAAVIGSQYNAWSAEPGAESSEPRAVEIGEVTPVDYVPQPTVGIAVKNEKVARQLRAQLEKPVDPVVLLEETTLREFAKSLSAWLRISVVIDETALDEIGIDTDETMELDVTEGGPFEASLRRALKKIDHALTWMVRDGVMQITTREVEEENPIVRLYDVADLCGCDLGGPFSENCDFDPIVEIITLTVEPDSWKDAGGRGQIVEVDTLGLGALCVSTTEEAHDQIEGLLPALRKMRHEGVGYLLKGFWCGSGLPMSEEEKAKWAPEAVRSRCRKTMTPLPVPKPTVNAGPQPTKGEMRILAALDTSVDLKRLTDEPTTLEKMVDELSGLTEIVIVFDEMALDELGIGLDSPVTVDLWHPVSMRFAFRHLLDKIDPELTFLIKNERLTITTKEVESENLVTYLYDVADLTARCTTDYGALKSEIGLFTGLVTTIVEPDSWEEAGGYGRISELELFGIRILAVSTSEEIHVKVGALFDGLRRMRRKGTQLFDCSCGSPPDSEKQLQLSLGGFDLESEAADSDNAEVEDGDHGGESSDGSAADAKGKSFVAVQAVEPAAPSTKPRECSDAKVFRMPKPKATVTVGQRHAEVSKKLLAALDKPVDLGEFFKEVDGEHGELSLEEFANKLAAKLGIAIVIDGVALDELGLGTDSPVNARLSKSISGNSALRIVLSKIDRELTWIVLNEVVTITTKEVESENLITKFYDVVDLSAACVTCGGNLRSDFDPIIELIETTVETNSWEDAGGAGRLAEMDVTGFRILVVAATREIHEQVEGLLVVIRAVRHEEMGVTSCEEYEAALAARRL